MADPNIVARFTVEGSIARDALPVASLSVLWYVEPDGTDGVVSKFDGDQRVSVTVGDLMALIHTYLHDDEEAEQ